jgi:hypothetical protein
MALGPAGNVGVGGAGAVGLPLEQLELLNVLLQVTSGLLGIRLEFLRHRQLVGVQLLVLEDGAQAKVS